MPPYLFLRENIENYIGKSNFSYIVSDHDNPRNHPIYAIDIEIGSTIFHISDDIPKSPINKPIGKQEKGMGNSVWKIFFDGSCSKEGSSVGIVFISPAKEVIPLSYKLELETTKNIS